ncbi:MAG: DegV family EDD domain-containing protein [Spirochaetes bacterium]|nr:DegV family EDD domain-containing protein [Spirochaetota bacterium]
MSDPILRAFILGAERVAAWADLLDSINVFPIADGDTGRNLKISLAPLRDIKNDRDRTIHRLLVHARGNSGNIAARFFSGFLSADSPASVPAAAKLGRDRAWEAVHDPKPGTMLTFFDALVSALEGAPAGSGSAYAHSIIERLEEAVRSTTELLPKLKEAGVVDSGALGMFIYFEGFFKSLAGDTAEFRPITSVFSGRLSIASSFRAEKEEGYCVDITLEAGKNRDEAVKTLAGFGESVVVIPGDTCVKVHLHTGDASEVRKRMESLGTIIRWTDDNLAEQITGFGQRGAGRAIHIMTDAAGSVTRDDATRLGMTLLDSYVTVGDLAAPETSVSSADVYNAMRRGGRASTSQASEFERHELYRSVTSLNPRTLYLCVGSAYTGNYDVAVRWKNENDPDNRLTVIDTGAASGRLGTIALAAARFANSADDAERVIDYARTAIEACREYIFINTLKFLAAGGRISKTKAFFGNMLNMMPVVSPTASGVVQAGMAKNLDEQLAFALSRLDEGAGARPFIMLQYTDNRALVEEKVLPAIAKRRPSAEIILQPLSLTTGVHVGPGTWSVAFLPEIAS